MIRSLPIRLEPRPGESATSWLCALAYRNCVTWQQILAAVGLYRRRNDTRRLRWAARLHPHEIQNLATATGLTAEALTAMTLARFDGIGLTTGRRPPRKDLGALRACHNPWRYCPHCLSDSGGRWQVQWALGFSFACIEHKSLLADFCPDCGRVPQRRAPLAHAIPNLSACGQASANHTRGRRCGADLTDVPRIAQPAGSDVIRAQRVVNSVIADSATHFRLYRQRPASAAAVLADLRAIGNQALALGVYRSPPAHFRAANPRGETHYQSQATAAALTAAVHILDLPDIDTAGARLTALAEQARPSTRRTQTKWTTMRLEATTSTLTALRISAARHSLSPSDQLRFRAFTSRPHRPARPEAVLAKVTRALPSQLWGDWVRDLCPQEDTSDIVRGALSCAVTLVGTQAPLRSITALLGIDDSASSVWKTLRHLESDSDWTRIALGVTRLADHIATHPVVIDYHRRRRLTYDFVLTPTQCERLHEITAHARPVDVAVVKCVLFERLSGQPIRYAPWYRDHHDFHGACRHIGDGPSAEVRLLLDEIALAYLAGCGIAEPITACPELAPPD
ncbi:TniQ family protein [Candidatus Mycobacterium wuenschmannii]|uniref:TniQ family protein n=1 Tax=Candidatus Mycobacterium wuenschmannii TaxID=3027808 RepID=A0ABY8W3K4_9MYCO|nr:TniQ family protein [Candidatus Mycobacterium wuenschmannii]WIM89755.1 TniQ family protein [Candidatus Mycobacterium wuenschmannii]